MQAYDIAVIGAGPAGIMAAIRAAQLKRTVVLIERNSSIGKKLLMTGKGRCNITNTAPIDEFMDKFGKSGVFLRTAFSRFFNEDLIDFFKSRGLEMKTERQARVFPATDNAMSVVKVLESCLAENNVKVICNGRVKEIKPKEGIFHLSMEDEEGISAKKVILATGGASYKATGSTGDGFDMAKKLGHTITPLKPGLVPLKTKEGWVKEVQGLTLKNIRLTFMFGKKKIVSDVGELLFTHFGISGPLVLDLSRDIVSMIEGGDVNVGLFIDLKPGLEHKQIENKLLAEIKVQGNKELKNFLKIFLPVNLIPVFISLSGVSPDRKANQLTQKERRSLQELFKAMPLAITGSLAIEEAMVTCGGVSKKEIDPRTMESRIIKGMYFAGEIIDGCASSGGYNLQQAFSTGYLAGEEAAACAG